MTEKDKNILFKYLLIYFCVFGIMTVTGGLMKTIYLFYKQVIATEK